MRATLESVCYQVRDILEAMNKDCGFPLVQLQVDGGMTANSTLLQLQADLVGLNVIRPTMAESSALVNKNDEREDHNFEKSFNLSNYNLLGSCDCSRKSRWQMGSLEKDRYRRNGIHTKDLD